MKYLICDHCKNIVTYLSDSGVPVFCCGQKMTELKANTVDAAFEKHIPEVTRNGNTLEVSVGSVAHPMTPEHFIDFVSVETSKGTHFAKLSGEPKALFALLDDEEVVKVLAYCNLHGLWEK